jgi:D-serine deaminase-like pyridoxal phosphate-dependent protein
LATTGTTGGLSVTNLGEAEVFAAYGFQAIFVDTAVVTTAKLRRLYALAQQISPIVAVEHTENVQALAAATESHHLRLHVMVNVRCQAQTTGVSPGTPAVALVHLIYQTGRLDFAGLGNALAT